MGVHATNVLMLRAMCMQGTFASPQGEERIVMKRVKARVEASEAFEGTWPDGHATAGGSSPTLCPF